MVRPTWQIACDLASEQIAARRGDLHEATALLLDTQ